MSTRWARTALCTLAVAAATLLGTAGAGASGAATRPATDGTPLALASQTPWVTPDAPWFDVTFAVGAAEAPASSLHVSLTFYSRLDDSSQLQQAIAGTPPTTALLRLSDVPVSAGAGGLTASTCVTVLPDAGASAPVAGTGACAAGSPTLTLDCTPRTGRCGDVYPVAVSLLRQGSSAPLAHFTTFLTYQEPGAYGNGGKLRVGVVVPVSTGGATAMAGALANHRDVPTTLAVNPLTVSALEQVHGRDGLHALDQLAALDNAEVLDEPYVPVNVAALSEAGLAGEIGAQLGRGDDVLRAAGLKPAGGPWVDTTSSFSQGDAGNLASGLQVAGASQLVLNDGDLATGGLSNYTFAQPFTLDLGHGSTLAAAAAELLAQRTLHRPAGRPRARRRAAARRAVLRPLRERVPDRAARRGRVPAGQLAAVGDVPRHPARRAQRQPRPQRGDPRPALHPGARRGQPRARGAPAAARPRRQRDRPQRGRTDRAGPPAARLLQRRRRRAPVRALHPRPTRSSPPRPADSARRSAPRR